MAFLSLLLFLNSLLCSSQTFKQQQLTHKKPPLGAAASNYLGEEGQGKWRTGWREKRRKEGGGHTHSCAGFEADTTLCRKVNTGNGSREVECKKINPGKKGKIGTGIFNSHTR